MEENKKTIFVGVAIISLFFFFTIFGDRGLTKVRLLTLERDALKEKADAIEEENRILTREIALLKNDIRTIERAARGQLDLVREDEILYKFAD